MCGRFGLLTDYSILVQSFDIRQAVGEYRTGSNICPRQEVSTVIHRSNQNILVNFIWGLIPSWSKDPSIGNRMFNARAETVSEKPSFKDAFRKRRCLVLADSFYEWRREGNRKIPIQFFLKSGEHFGFAGLYEHWISPDNKQINTCTIITTQSNEIVNPIHNRMPVILPNTVIKEWIEPGYTDEKRLLSILRPYPATEMNMKTIDPYSLR
jgi:putative SOS response-associated peptidase YedK